MKPPSNLSPLLLHLLFAMLCQLHSGTIGERSQAHVRTVRTAELTEADERAHLYRVRLALLVQLLQQVGAVLNHEAGFVAF